MNEKMKERTLKQAVRRTSDPVEMSVRTRGRKSKHARTKKSERVERSATPRIQSKSRETARMTKLKKTSTAIPTTETVTIEALCSVETQAVGEENLPAQSVITVDEIIPCVEPCVEVEREEQESLQSVSASDGAVTNPGLSSIRIREMDCEPEVAVAEIVIAEKETDAPEIAEVMTDAEMPQATGSQRGIIRHGLSAAWKWARKHLRSGQSRKRLRVCESVSLGEKRFVAVIEVDGEQFLVGGASSSVATLARLEPSQEFSEVLKRRWAQDPIQA
jgi:flagellar biogenesis protein FliO